VAGFEGYKMLGLPHDFMLIRVSSGILANNGKRGVFSLAYKHTEMGLASLSRGIHHRGRPAERNLDRTNITGATTMQSLVSR
jgi:hypothetical protein